MSIYDSIGVSAYEVDNAPGTFNPVRKAIIAFH
jgi:hypothetical protein